MESSFPALSRFHPLPAEWFRDRYGEPTEIQSLAWPVIQEGRHALIIAPTGSGKTLTAFLDALDGLLSGRMSTGGLRVLYISPLKALNTDIRRNLLSPLEELKDRFAQEDNPFPSIRVAVRSGDSTPEERRSMLRHPPEILITTPESLNILLTSKGGREIFPGLQVVILDEIHAVAPAKRGIHLITAVERLELLAPGFQRIALSATVEPPSRIAAFVGGFALRNPSAKNPVYEPRPVEIIRSNVRKNYAIEVDFPLSEKQTGNGEEVPDDALWEGVTHKLKEIIARNRSTLIFTNSRRMAEKVSMLLNEGEEKILAYSHHGALSREIRTVVEQSLKEGTLPAVVATASLELGIDIGDLDQVVLLQSPGLLSTTLQRLGRAGHGVGQVSRGLFLPLNGRDILQAAILAGSIGTGEIEETTPILGALDVLSQIILSMVVAEEWNPDDLFAFLRTTYPYHKLERTHFDSVIDMLTGRFASSRIQELKPRLHFDRVENRIRAAEGAALLLYMNGGTIPDRGYYTLRHRDSQAKIGELDEEFIWERSPGDVFTLGNQSWQIQEITHNDVLVVPAPVRSIAMAPFWRADAQDRDALVSEKLARFLEEKGANIERDGFRRELEEKRHLTSAASSHLQGFLLAQKESTGPELPHRHHLVIEHYEDSLNRSDRKAVILHTLWGGRVNRPFSLAIRSAFERNYHLSVEVLHDDDCIGVMLPHEFTEGHLLELVKASNLEELLRSIVSATGFFGALFRQYAGVAMLLPGRGFKQRTPLWLNRLRSRKILQATVGFEDFPVVLETWRSCLSDEFDLKTLLERLAEIESGKIRITEVLTKKPSPFAGNLIWQQTNQYMYQDDTPGTGGAGKPGEDFFRDLARASGLRPTIPTEVIELYRNRRMRISQGYEPDEVYGLIDLIHDRIFISEKEFQIYLLGLIPEVSGEERERHTDFSGNHSLLDELDSKEQEALERGLVRAVFTRHSFLKEEPPTPGPEAGRICTIENAALLEYAMVPCEIQFFSLRYPEKKVNERTREVLRHLQEEFRHSNEKEGETLASPAELLARLLLSFLRFYGPVKRGWLLQFFPAPSPLDRALEILREDERMTEGKISATPPGSSPETEICDLESLEILLRMTRSQLRTEFEALPVSHLQLFLSHHQRLTRRGEELDDLKLCMEQLIGFPAKATLWETEILPARLHPYFPSWLDRLAEEFGLFWMGCEKETITFIMERDLRLLKSISPTGGDASTMLSKIFPSRKGRYPFFELMDASGWDSGELTKTLWGLAWKGLITNDSLRTLRNGIDQKFKGSPSSKEGAATGRVSFARWSNSLSSGGAWRILPLASFFDDETEESLEGPAETEGGEKALNVLEEEGKNRERVQILLGRYGILFRELLLRELPPFQWKALAGTLRRMELSGEVQGGYFFHGIRSLQFMSPSAFRTLQKGLPGDAIYWMNATDPASLCGIRLEGLSDLPSRIAGNHIFFAGADPVLYSRRNGQELEILLSPEDRSLPECLSLFREFLNRERNPISRLTVETINGESATDSPYEAHLLKVGFYKNGSRLCLRRQYSS